MRLKNLSPVLLFLFALLAYSLGFFGVLPQETALFFMTIAGFSGVGALRSFILSHGLKTYITVAGALLVAFSMIFGVVDYQTTVNLLISLGLLSGAALGHAVYKIKD